jgi:hypothetical protein
MNSIAWPTTDRHPSHVKNISIFSIPRESHPNDATHPPPTHDTGLIAISGLCQTQTQIQSQRQSQSQSQTQYLKNSHTARKFNIGDLAIPSVPPFPLPSSSPFPFPLPSSSRGFSKGCPVKKSVHLDRGGT